MSINIIQTDFPEVEYLFKIDEILIISSCEKYLIVKRNGEMTVMEKRRYLLEKALKKKTADYAAIPKYVPAQNL